MASHFPTDVEHDFALEEKIHIIMQDPLEVNYEGWERGMLRNECKLIFASSKPRQISIHEFTVSEKHINRMGNMHGGAVSTLFDATGGFPLVPVSKPGFWETSGVSRSLNVTYLRPISLGMTILVENELVHAGKKQALIKAFLKRKSDGAILATCEHGRASVVLPGALKHVL